MKLPLLDFRHLQMIAVLADTPRATDAAEHQGLDDVAEA